jgi:transcriptional regulator with XRE-family HTH domain
MTSTPELVKHRFSQELRRCCGSHYQTIPSNEQFARDLYLSSKYVLKVSRETVRKWFKGDSFPDLDHLLHLIKWLGLDMTKVFVDELQLEKNKVAAPHLQFLDISSIEQITPEQIDSFVGLLNSIKNSDLVKSRRR